MKKSIFFALFLTAGLFFLNACDVVDNITNPYKDWYMTINMTPKPSGITEVDVSSASISLGTVSSIVFDSIIKNANDDTQSISNVSWTMNVEGRGPLPVQFVNFLIEYNRVEISTGFAINGDKLVISTYWQDLVKTSTITFTN
ncbi:MAG: hypothetical protein FWD54_00900 [Endomicrobia bacterium]|nr:hypothetical protein [Endomicrobiia bacterium]